MGTYRTGDTVGQAFSEGPNAALNEVCIGALVGNKDLFNARGF